MSKLLDRLNAAVDAVFDSRKNFIAEQSLPAGIYSQSEIVATGEYVSVTAPVSGYATVRVPTADNPNNETIRLRVSNDTAAMGNSTFKLTNGLADQYVPCKKGDTLVYMSSQGNTSQFYFIKNRASA